MHIDAMALLASDLTPLDKLSDHIVLVFVVLGLTLIAGLLIIFLTRNNNKIVERPPVFGAEPEKDTEPTQNVDMTVPGAEDLTLSQEDISVHPVPQLGHPDDEGVPVPKYDEETKALVVDTDVAPVDVNASVPVPPPSEAVADDVPLAEANEADEAGEAEPVDTGVHVWERNGAPLFDTTAEETTPEDKEIPMDVPETDANENEETTGAEENTAGVDEGAAAASASRLDSVKAKFEGVKEKAHEIATSEKAQEIRSTLETKAGEAKEKATQLWEKAHEIATSEKAQEIRSTLETKAGEAKEKATELWEKAKASAQDENSLIGQAKRKAHDLKEKISKDNPDEDSVNNG